MSAVLKHVEAETRVTFVCSDSTARIQWHDIDAPQEPLVRLGNPFQALRMLGDGGARYGWEISRVIIDQDVEELGFLEFLSRLPKHFRGDVLFLANDRRAFLSAMGRHDDRVLYALTREDVDFYISTMLASDEMESRRTAC